MKKYNHALSKRGITQRKQLRQPVIENFFGIMKSEFFYLKEFESVEHFKPELAKYIHY